jgi:MoaA/NifB/PqqE/SkfB family radical SAM enzyme
MDIKNNNYFNVVFDGALIDDFKKLVLLGTKRFRYIPFLIRSIKYQRNAVVRRKKNEESGIQVPLVLAISITNKCNLNCVGCYQKSQIITNNSEFTDEEIIRIIRESHDLGSGIVFLLGGEPLMRDIFGLVSEFKDMIFALYTNSLLINDEVIGKFKKNLHILPILSMEGIETDNRRGKGVLEKIMKVVDKLNKEKILFGLSVTVTSKNINDVCCDEFVVKMIKKGNMFFSYYRYIPIDKNTIELTLSPEQDIKFKEFTKSFRLKYNAIFVSPENEKRYGGCLGAGKGVVHISASGELEACPFAPYSDVSVKNMSLKEALQSKLFQNLRQHHKTMIDNNLTICSLWKNEQWENAAKTNDFTFLEKEYATYSILEE